MNQKKAVLECPRCDGKLFETEYNGIVVDVCDKCTGVWLDAGELVHLAVKEEKTNGWLRANCSVNTQVSSEVFMKFRALGIAALVIASIAASTATQTRPAATPSRTETAISFRRHGPGTDG